MTTIPSAIASLLYDHDTVIVPGFGAFVRHDQSANVNVITNEFKRPSSSLGFDPQQREENALISDYLMACDGLGDEEARTAIAGFVNECFASLKEKGSVSLPELGTLTMDEQQNLVFEPLPDTNFNGDAFGLEDLNPQPVFGGKSENGDRNDEGIHKVKAETGSPLVETTIQPIKPTEFTESTDSTDSTTSHRSLWWLWLLLLLLIAAGVVLWYFKFRPVPTQPWPLRPVPAMQPREKLLPRNPEPATDDSLASTGSSSTPLDTLGNLQETSETASETISEPQTPASIEVVKPEPTSKAFIVGGCFEVEKNALIMVTDAREQGCAEAFVMKRGRMYYVCYGQYLSTADAKAALPYALDNYNKKAWILTK